MVQDIQIIKSSSPKKIKTICDVILKNRIYRTFGSMKYMASDDLDLVEFAAVAYVENKPVASFLKMRQARCSYYNIGIYVRPKYRRRGIGTQLIKSMPLKFKKGVSYYDGTYESSKFWKKTLS